MKSVNVFIQLCIRVEGNSHISIGTHPHLYIEFNQSPFLHGFSFVSFYFGDENDSAFMNMLIKYFVAFKQV